MHTTPARPAPPGQHIARRRIGRHRPRLTLPRRFRLALVPVAVGAVAVTAAVVLYHDRGYHTPSDAGVVPSGVSTRQAGGPVAGLNSTAARQRTRARHVAAGARPVRLAIENIHVDARVIPVGVHSGSLDVPADPRTLGWWSGGAKPGSSTGSVVIDGHVDSAKLGLGALFYLGKVAMGSPVSVDTTSGRLTYKVVGRRVYDKQSLPHDVFASGGPPRLVLITCGGPFNSGTRQYADNVVVYAVPVS